jgi:hypothetical protein
VRCARDGRDGSKGVDVGYELKWALGVECEVYCIGQREGEDTNR